MPRRCTLVITLAFLGCATPGWASVAFVSRAAPNGASAASSSSLLTTAAVHTAGNTLVCAIHRQSGSAVSSVVDTASDTFSNAVSNFAVASDTDRIDIWYSTGIAGHASNVIQVTLGSASVYASVTCDQFTPSTYGASATGSGTSSGTMATASVTTTGSDSVIYAAYKNDGAVYTAGSGYVMTTYAVSGDATLYFMDEYHLVSASEVATASQAGGGGANWGAAAVSFNGVATSTATRGLLGVGR